MCNKVGIASKHKAYDSLPSCFMREERREKREEKEKEKEKERKIERERRFPPCVHIY